MITPVVVLPPILVAPPATTPILDPLVDPEPILPSKVTPPVTPAAPVALISRVASASVVPIIPVSLARAEPETISRLRLVAFSESTFPSIVIVPSPPVSSVVMAIVAASSCTSPVIETAPPSTVVILPFRIVGPVTVTSSISVSMAFKKYWTK